ncbi:histidine triad nucleotide-binding protein [Spirochaetia bacterium]|nr:histidine triad nucleotide-binding protein [Spirochaetia bacterium]GHU30332.1 histidine triad nucleotide-binding protein [Spirochaetia bacterium]
MEDCIFCKIAAGTIPSKKVYEDDECFAFHDISPQGPVHFLVIPKKHIRNIMETTPEDEPLLGRLLYRAQKLAVECGCGERGARFVINCKDNGGQTVDHLHIHVVGGRFMEWPPG